MDSSDISHDTLLLAGGFDRLADLDGSHGVYLLRGHDAEHECGEDRCNGEQEEGVSVGLDTRRFGKVRLRGVGVEGAVGDK
jgi:hypothetical protein